MVFSRTAWTVGKISKNLNAFIWLVKVTAYLGDKSIFVRALPILFESPGAFEASYSSRLKYGDKFLYSRQVAITETETLLTTSSLESQLLEIPSFHERCVAIRKIEKYIQNKAWVEIQYQTALNTLELVSSCDGIRLAYITSAWFTCDSLYKRQVEG